MKNKLFGIYAKVFFYTILILLVVVCVAAMFFSNQITAALESMESQQLLNVFAPLVSQFGDKSEGEIIAMAKEFCQKNASVEFIIQAADGSEIYKTPNAATHPDAPPSYKPENDVPILENNGGNKAAYKKTQMTERMPNGMMLIMRGASSGGVVYDEFIRNTIIVLLILFFAGSLGAAVFAYQITKPIRNIARDTKRMSDLEFVPPPVARRDEIGQLAKDVYRMYEELKTEIERAREMEENQRYFFSAASHELKTPNASVRTILEGMLDDLIEVSEYPEYLHECIKVIDQHNKLISEILEVTQLTDDSMIQEKTQICLQKFIDDILIAHAPLVEAKKQTVDIDMPSDVTITADRRLFGRAISNVILNAIQNTPDEGHIKIFTQKNEYNGKNLCILNMGVNIDETLLPKLFQPFYRADEARSRGQGRSGIGLTIVQKALDKMQIPFGLENADEGVLFWIELIK
jgi:two-component system sensor histidine kinase VanS